MNRESTVYTVIFTFLAAFLFVFILSLAFSRTSGLVKENQVKADRKAMLSSIGLFPEDLDIMDIYNKIFENAREENDLVYVTYEGQNLIVKAYFGSGLWGTISGYISVTEDLSTIAGLEFLSHNETPGLGGRIDEVWFKDQFRGERINAEGIKVSPGTGSSDEVKSNSRVDGITGASRTSSSVEIIVNKEIQNIKNIMGGGK